MNNAWRVKKKKKRSNVFANENVKANKLQPAAFNRDREIFEKMQKDQSLSLSLPLPRSLKSWYKGGLLSLHAAFSSIQTDREAWKLSTLFKYSTLRSLRLVIFEKPAPFLPFEKLGRAGSCFSRSSNCFEAEKIHRCARFKKRGNREGEKREKCCTRRRTVSLIYDTFAGWNENVSKRRMTKSIGTRSLT